MSEMRQNFWLLLGTGIVLIDGLVGAIMFLICRRIMRGCRSDGITMTENGLYVVSDRRQKETMNSTLSEKYLPDHDYENNRECVDMVKAVELRCEPVKQDDQEMYEILDSGYVDVQPEPDEDYDDVAPSSGGTVYDNIDLEISHSYSIRPLPPLP